MADEIATDVNDDDEELAWSDTDPILEALVQQVEAGASFSITLHVGGLVVSGTLVNLEAFLELQAAAIRDRGVGEGVEGMAALFDRMCELVRDSDRDRDDFTPRYINLSDVTTFAGAQTFKTTLWRGPLSAVDGWQMAGFTAPSG